jgi:hypothetical protein
MPVKTWTVAHPGTADTLVKVGSIETFTMSQGFKKEVLDQLRANGSDTSKPHRFEFYLYMPTKSYAAKAAEKMLKSGFSEAKVTRSASERGWLCLAQKTLIPKNADLDDHARFLEEVAAAVGGDLDGWEAELIKI